MIFDNVLALIGRTPLVRLARLTSKEDAEVVVKLEAMNPAGSVKDRVALSLIEDAETRGSIRPGDTLVEPTSGNTGIGLAMVAAVKGYRLIITMPDDASEVRRSLLRRYGAQIILTPAGQLMHGAIARAQQIVAETPRAFMLQQFENEANPRTHEERTAREILDDTDGKLDAFVAGIGTGGTLMGVGRAMRRLLEGVELVAVEPARSPALSGGEMRTHAIEGMGPGFVSAIIDRSLIDEVLRCEDDAARQVAKELAAKEGISAGPSGGAAVWGALQVARRLGPGHRVVTVIPDAWDRYGVSRSLDPRSTVVQ